MARKKVEAAPQESADLVEIIGRFDDDPLGFVLYVFPWAEPGTILHDEEGPDEWQVRFLLLLGKLVREGRMAEAAAAIQIAVASGHGVGKTALVAWVILWFMSTRAAPQIVVTANTASQLTGKTWRELGKWHKLAIHKDWFQWTATKFYLKERPEDWFATAQPWSKERAEAFAGTHDKNVLMLFDEASAIDDGIWEVAEGAMTTPGAIWLAFGNPTRNTGRFRECFRRFRHRWHRMQVDSRKAKKADRTKIDAWIEDYGEDSDFVRIRVRGIFPRASSNQLIDGDLVEEAMRRKPHPGANDSAAKILVVDVARFGDDQSVVAIRQGTEFRVLRKYRELDLEQLSFRVAEWIDAETPDAVFVDANGMGAGVVDRLRALGYEVTEVNAGFKAADDRTYYNKRAEMWGAARDWLRRGGCLPDDEELKDDLTGPEYGFDNKGRIQLESKDDMKARGLPSPDTGDCLAMSFFMPVAPRISRENLLARLHAQDRHAGSWMAY